MRPSTKRRLLLVLCWVALTLLSLTAATEHARAAIGERVRSYGAEFFEIAPILSRLGGAGPSEPTLLRLNGAMVRVGVRSFAGDPLEATAHLLSSFEEECSKPLRDSDGPALIGPPTFSDRAGGEGVALCYKPREPLSFDVFQEMQARASQSAPDRSLDLTEWGSFQSLFVRPGDAGVTAVSVEVLAGLRPSEMFPLEGDAPGEDFSEIPRPTGRRLLSVALGDAPALNAYEIDAPVEQALSDYRSALALLEETRVSYQEAKLALLVRRAAGDFVVAARQMPLAPHGEPRTGLTLARLPR